MTPSCPIDRMAFSTVGVRDQVGEKETGKAQVATKKTVNREQELVMVESPAFGKEELQEFLKKVQRQERIVEEVKLVLKPAYNARKINKEAYKEILRKTVPKVWATSVVFFCIFSQNFNFRCATADTARSTHLRLKSWCRATSRSISI